MFLYLGLNESQIAGGKKQKRVDQDLRNTCAKIQDLSHKDGVNVWTFVRKTCVVCIVVLKIVRFSVLSIFGALYFT